MPGNRTSSRQEGQADARFSSELGDRSTREFLNQSLRAVGKVYGKRSGKTSARNVACEVLGPRQDSVAGGCEETNRQAPGGRAQGPAERKTLS
jgi:hypothetical protein